MLVVACRNVISFATDSNRKCIVKPMTMAITFLSNLSPFVLLYQGYSLHQARHWIPHEIWAWNLSSLGTRLM